MAFNKWAKQIDEKKQQNTLEEHPSLTIEPISIPPAACRERRDDPTRTKRADFLAIQDKINKALQDIDDIYDKTTTNDPLLNDIQLELEHMDNPQFKLKMTSLIDKYNNQQAQVESMDNERVQILCDLADWFSMDHMSSDESTAGQTEAEAEAKFEFAKFNEINVQLTKMNQDEPGFEDLKIERHQLQNNVMKAFKNTKEAARRNEMIKEASGSQDVDDSGWKHAAGEIVDMLGKVRSEGKQYISELETKIKKMLKDSDELMRKLKRCQKALEEKKQMEKKWKEESTMQTKEKTILQSQLKKIKKELKKTRKALARYEAVAPMTGLSGSSLTVDSSEDTEVQLHTLKSQHDTLQKENTALLERIKGLEQQLQKTDEELSNLEHDKLELLYQMKQAALRPNTRHLSNLSSTASVNASASLIVTSATSFITEKDSHKPRTDVPTSRDQVCSKCAGDMEATPIQNKETKQDTVEEQKDDAVLAQEQIREEKPLMKKLEGLQQQVTSLEEQLVRAHQELIEAKATRLPSPAPSSPLHSPVENSGVSQPTTRPELKNKTVPAEMEVVAGPVTTPTTSRRRQGWVDDASSADKDIILVDQCIQTDPGLDPLSDWSKPHKQERGWRPPVPPNKWVDFDPTMPQNPERRYSIDQSMLKGAEPSEIKQEAETASRYISGQLKRMVAGILSFKDYIDTIVDRETMNMVRANKKLKSLLSPTELQCLKEEVSGTSTVEDPPNMSTMFSAEIDELSDVGKSDLSAEEKVEMTMGIIANKTIMMLAQAVERLSNKINEQRRPAGFHPQLDESMQEEEFTPPTLQRSRSLCSLDVLAREQGIEDDQGKQGLIGHQLTTGPQPHAQRSHSDIIIKETITSGQAEDRTVNTNREAFKVSQATVPKKGRIQLTTLNMTKQNQMLLDSLGPYRDLAAQRRKTKPAPISHNKLKKRQKDLLFQNKTKVITPSKKAGSIVPRELPNDYFDEYTIGDLERRAEKYGETVATTEHMRLVEASADIRSDVEKREAIGQTLPQLQRPDVLPPVRTQRTSEDMRFPPI